MATTGERTSALLAVVSEACWPRRAATDLAEGTLPAIGEALHAHSLAMRDILDQMETQRLGEDPDRQGGVEERRAIYAVAPLRMAAFH